MQAEYDVSVEWRGLEIHPEIPPEGLHWPEHLRARFGGMSDALKQEAHQAGLEIVIPEIIPNSRQALEASEYARQQGLHEAFHEVRDDIATARCVFVYFDNNSETSRVNSFHLHLLQ